MHPVDTSSRALRWAAMPVDTASRAFRWGVAAVGTGISGE